MKINIASKFLKVFSERGDFPAICINEIHYSYKELCKRTATIQEYLISKKLGHNSIVGIASSNCIDCYASIIACILSGHAFLPLSASGPKDRILKIIGIASPSIILCFTEEDLLTLQSIQELSSKNTTTLTSAIEYPTSFQSNENDNAYILFTSGSTGEPKGVRITRKNLNSFYSSLDDTNFLPNFNDKVLHIFDLNFDFSIVSYLIPFACGSCVYTLDESRHKFLEAYRVLNKYKITVAPLVPSILNFLSNYFDEISLPNLRLCIFCGEPLRLETLIKWINCCKNSKVVNFYGPTECTVFSHYYSLPKNVSDIKTSQGIVSFGIPLPNVYSTITDKNLNKVNDGEIGELCLGGDQLTDGYLRNDQLNKYSFFNSYKSKNLRLYRTGDLAYKDLDGDYFFCGRTDNQIKINGYRIELGEIEYTASSLYPDKTWVAITLDETNLSGIYLFTDSQDRIDQELIVIALNQKLPSYMIPKKIFQIDNIPLTNNLKIDRKELVQYVKKFSSNLD